MTITTVQRKEDSLIQVRDDISTLKMPEVYTFDSRSEAVCAIILEQFVRGWETKRGYTWQIALPFDKFADFRVGNNIIEFHPIVLSHEFKNPRAFKRFDQSLDRISPHLRKEFEESIKQEKAKEYFCSRRMILNASQEFRYYTLFHCENSWEFAETVAIHIIKNRSLINRIYSEWEKCFDEL